MSRRYGLMGPNTVRIVALVLAVGMAAGMGIPYLVQAGVPVWTAVLLAVAVLAVPIIAMNRDKTRD
ncbi:hypothetical protein GCM10009854_36940 [Saccharopolyspora halophila]|uniref:DUF3099 domain-containing protein n=1 Tax=Saccharopolyspora halophila TaxID=405551 RepID=A0ABN3GMK4_9PSEU